MVRRRFLSSREASWYSTSQFRTRQNHGDPLGKPSAEVREKYFCAIKISTQMLISLWKSPAGAPLTSRVSILFS